MKVANDLARTGSDQHLKWRRPRPGQPLRLSLASQLFAPEAPPAKWAYSTDFDEKLRREFALAETESVDSVMLPSLYGGETRAVLAVKSSRNYREVVFRVTNGCLNIPYACSISTRCDVETVRIWRAQPSRNGDLSTLVLDQPIPFIRTLSGSQALSVEVELFGAGMRKFTFRPEGLDLKRLVAER